MTKLMEKWETHLFAGFKVGKLSIDGSTVFTLSIGRGEVTSLTCLAIASAGDISAFERTFSSEGFDLESAAQGLVTKKDGAEVTISTALRGFGIGVSTPEYAERSVAEFIGSISDLGLPDETGAQLRQMLLSREVERMTVAATGLIDLVNSEIIDLFVSSDAYSWSDYKFYSAEGDRGMRRRQAASAFPILATLFPRRPGLRMAIDTAKSLNEALMSALGEKMTKGALKRLQAIKWAPNGVPVERICQVVSEMPVDWVPTQKDEWDAFCEITNSTGLVISDLCNFPIDQIYAGSSGKWIQYGDRIAKAYTDTRPPEGMNDVEGAAWLKTRPVPKLNGYAAKAASGDAGDMIASFAAQVVLPLAARETKCFDIEVAQFHLQHASKIASDWLFGGKSAPAILELSRAWHGQQDAIATALSERLVVEEVVHEDLPDGGWPPAILREVVAPNGVIITPLYTREDLVREGRELDHCVGGYAARCETGEIHILSLRRDVGGVRRSLSTAEIRNLSRDGTFTLQQNRGIHNWAPPSSAQYAWEWFTKAAAHGEIPFNHDGVAICASKASISSSVDKVCGYNWKCEADVELAFNLWKDFLTKAIRKNTLSELSQLPGILDLAELILPNYANRVRLVYR